jgi:hypothetical protein
MILFNLIQQCRHYLANAFVELGVVASEERLNFIAKVIIESMTGPWRSFHTPEHIFELAQGGDAIEVLSALFHDTVYVQVDRGISSVAEPYLLRYLYEENQQLLIANAHHLVDEPSYKLCLMTFGFEPGQALPLMEGQNEFLSALLAAKILEDTLPLSLIAQIIACIEATIPFRAPDHNGLSSSDHLLRRLKKVNAQFGFSWSTHLIEALVQRSVRLSNRDVENFYSPNPADFLEVTWKLIPETNHYLNGFKTYSIQGYQAALQRMEGFMNYLKSDIIFKQYLNEPTQEKYDIMLWGASRNLEVARLYLGLKLVPIAISEALSLPDNVAFKGLDQCLPLIDAPHLPVGPIEQAVISLFDRRVGFDAQYDPSNSPLALYLLKTLGLDQAQNLIFKAELFFAGELSAENFLKHLPVELVETLKKAITDWA